MFKPNIKNLVFSGGGVKGYSFIGAIKALNEHNIIDNVTTYAGTSIGSLLALTLCLNYSYSELYSMLTKLNITEFQHVTTENIINFFEEYGIDNGDKFLKIIEILINAKLKQYRITFKELYDKTNKKLIVAATCVNKKKIIYYNYLETPDAIVSETIRKSISVPFLFKPIKDESDGLLYVDGGLINNFPINLFKTDSKETLGFLLYSEECVESENTEITSFESYVIALMDCMYKETIRCYLKDYSDNMIVLKANVNFFNFFITQEDKYRLIEQGYQDTKKFLDKKYPKIPLFVYGTLMKDMSHHNIFNDNLIEIIEASITNSILYQFTDYPGLYLTESEDNIVRGELIKIKGEHYYSIMDKIIELKESDFELLQKEIILEESKEKIKALVWVCNKEKDSGTEIVSNWREYLESIS